MTIFRQGSFAAGEISPKLYSRADLVLYQTGLRTARNSVVMKQSGIENRPGTVFCDETRNPTKRVKLLPFVFSTASGQTYTMEFGDLYIEFLQDGGRVVEASKAIFAVTKANPGVVTSTSHGYSNGDHLILSMPVAAGMVELHNRRVVVANVSTHTFELTNTAGSNINTTAYTTYVASQGTCSKVYKVTTTYVEADLQDLRIAQSADVVTITHPTYPPRDLTRSGHTSWSIANISFVPTIGRPTTVAGTAGVSGSATTRYKVTAVDDETLIESLAGLSATKSITAVTKANPGVVTSTSHGYTNGDELYITGADMTELNGLVFTVANKTDHTYELLSTNTTSYTTYTTGGTSALTAIKIASAGTPTTAAPNALTWTNVSGASEYWIYKESNGIYGYIGAASITANQAAGAFSDTNITPDTSDTPPDPRNPFGSSGNYPAIVTYYQGRRVYARTNNDPEKIWASKTADFNNFTTSSPLLDDDAVTFTLTGRQVNEIRDLVDVGTSLVALTAGGEWAIRGDGSGVMRPGDTNQKQYSANGSLDLPALVVGSRLLYVQYSGEIIHDLGFQFESDSYSGDDISIRSEHIFRGKQVTDWAYQKNPGSVVWIVLDDGTVATCTYIRDQQIIGFAQHDTDGTVENVCCIPEGDDTAVYFAVKRTSGGSTKRYIERLDTREIDDISDAIFMDAAATYDGRNTGATTMKFSAASYAAGASVSVVASASYFVAGDVGNGIFITAADGSVVRGTITAYTSATVVTATVNIAVPSDIQAVATTNWAKAVDDLSGLWHLAGTSVSVIGDGFVVANPNDSDLTAITVSSTTGGITLTRPYAVIHVGLPYLSDIELLNLELNQQGTLIDRQKLITQVYLYLDQSRGMMVGPKPPSDDDTDPKEGLREVVIQNATTAAAPEDLVSDSEDVSLKGEWNSNGRVFIRQLDPLPMRLLSVNPYIPNMRV